MKRFRRRVALLKPLKFTIIQLVKGGQKLVVAGNSCAGEVFEISQPTRAIHRRADFRSKEGNDIEKKLARPNRPGE